MYQLKVVPCNQPPASAKDIRKEQPRSQVYNNQNKKKWQVKGQNYHKIRLKTKFIIQPEQPIHTSSQSTGDKFRHKIYNMSSIDKQYKRTNESQC